MPAAKDRLSELKKLQIKQENVEYVNNLQKENKQLLKIYEKVEQIRQEIDGIKGNTVRLENVLHTFYNGPRKEHHAEINSILNNFTKASYKVSNDLKNFETEFSKIKDENSSEGRIKKIQYANLQQSFQEVMEQNNQLIETYRNYVRDMYKKSARIADRSIEEEELDNLIDDKQVIQIFIDNHLADTDNAIQQLNDLKTRHAELLRIEEKVQEVHNLFMKMSVLVEQQQEYVDRVEYFALTAKDYVEQGAVDLHKTKKSKHKSHKLKLLIIFSIIILAAIVAVVLFK